MEERVQRRTKERMAQLEEERRIAELAKQEKVLALAHMHVCVSAHVRARVFEFLCMSVLGAQNSCACIFAQLLLVRLFSIMHAMFVSTAVMKWSHLHTAVQNFGLVQCPVCQNIEVGCCKYKLSCAKVVLACHRHTPKSCKSML